MFRFTYTFLLFYKMVKLKEGFRGERFVSLPEELLAGYSRDPLIGSLYLRKIGFFPCVKYHYIQKDKGCDYAMLVYCTDGQGWYRVNGNTYTVQANEYIIIPPDTPYAFGAENDNPWTIYWLHFQGSLAPNFLPSYPNPKRIQPEEHSRLEDRIRLFEEIYNCFSMGYSKEYMAYASLCLYQFLASFIYLEPYRSINRVPGKESSFTSKVIHYMEENIRQNLTLEQLATYFKYSPSHFSLLFRKETGVSPINYFIRLKMQKACQYIELTDLKISDISTRLGFDEPAYFSRLFTKIMGLSPSEYRKEEWVKRKS